MFECGFYEKEITPPLGCHIPGYFNVRASSDVADRLYARAMVIKSGDTVAAFISVDACSLTFDECEVIRKRVTEYTGIPTDNVLVDCVHSHTGIPRDLDSDKDENCKLNAEGYTTVFSKLIADCAILAYKRLTPSSLSFGVGTVDGISFCRNYYMKNATPQTNPPRLDPNIEGPVATTDNDLPVIFVKDESGSPIGAVISFACHSDCVGGTEYSGDYSSELSIQMKKLYGENFVTVFLLGCCGDINHFNVNTASDAPDHYRMMGRMILGEAQKVIATSKPVEGDGIKVSYELIEINRTQISEEKIAEARHIIATVKEKVGVKIAADGSDPDQYNLSMSKSLIRFIESTPESYNIPLQVIQLGDITIYAFPSEIYSYFGKLIKEKDGTGKAITVSLCNGSFGYVPTREMFYDTIYESKPGANKLNKEAGYIMSEKLLSMKK